MIFLNLQLNEQSSKSLHENPSDYWSSNWVKNFVQRNFSYLQLFSSFKKIIQAKFEQ